MSVENPPGSSRSRRRRALARWWLGLVLVAGLLVLGAVLIGVRGEALLLPLVAVALVALLLLTVLAFPSAVARLDQAATPSDAVKANEVRTALLQGFASILLLVGATVAFLQLRTSQRELQTTGQAQKTERFSRAVEQLASGDPAVRLGGIFTLVQMADQEEEQRPVVAQILAAYVQRTARSEGSPAPVRDEPPPPLQLTMPDVQACLDFLAKEPSGRRLLSTLLLDKVALRGVRLSGPGGAWLERARLQGADLSGATIVQGRLSGADLREAVLSGARLRGAVLRGADLERARFVEADFSDADLSSADLTAADLHGAELRGTSLRGARLVRANLSSARHVDGDVAGADLRHADLRGADLRNAKNLFHADLTGARCDPARTLLPTGPIQCVGEMFLLG